MREWSKAVARGLARCAVSPVVLAFLVKRRFIGSDRALEGTSQLLCLLPGLPGQYLRRAFLSVALDGGCATTAVVAFGTTFSKAGARIDERAYIGVGCVIGLVHVCPDVLIGSGVQITSGRHTHGTADPSRPIRDQQVEPSLVTIGAGTWIGSGAVVMADVGANSVVGAGAIVTRPLPPDVVAAGVPARVIRARTT